MVKEGERLGGASPTRRGANRGGRLGRISTRTKTSTLGEVSYRKQWVEVKVIETGKGKITVHQEVEDFIIKRGLRKTALTQDRSSG